MAFHGTFEHTLDAKNRLTVPSRFRSALAGRVFLVKGQDPCLSLYPAETYEAMANAALADRHADDAAAPRALPLLLRERAGDGARLRGPRDAAGDTSWRRRGIAARELIVAGTGACLELWDRTTWQTYDARADAARA